MRYIFPIQCITKKGVTCMLLHHRFIDTAKKFGDKMYIVDRTTNRRITYSRALIASLILSEKLQKYDNGFIGIMVPTSAGCILASLASLMSGRVPVMINYSTMAAQNCVFAQKKLAFKTILTSKALLEKIQCPVVPGMVFLEDLMESISVLDKLGAAVRSKLPAAMLKKTTAQGSDDDNLVILFTSGSEKEPKAVQLSHKNITANLQSLEQVLEVSDKDIMLGNLPMFHSFGQTAHLWLPIYCGMTVVTYANPLDFKGVNDAVREEKVTIFAGTPSFFWGYVGKSNPGDYDTCRIILAGADKCPDALRKVFMEKHNKVILEAYGCTETAPGLAVNTPSHNRPGSVGRMLPGVSVRIENHENGNECKPREIGKVLVKGDNIMKGYFDDFENTSLAFRHGYYDTGDMGWMDEDGYLWHVGRLKRFVKIGGEMISLIKVEDVLEKLLSEDTKCCVVEIPDQTKGAKIVAAVTRQINEKEILKKMGEQLPNIALPKQFVIIPELPQMGTGKIDFRTTTNMVRDLVQK
jgi:acyl-[acyl-carrier-protein]-phospholipid O-acyltransferase/long-chain-fatty-acid--[acyl-carrier-protein] ligase